jgi:hypothetical protein
MKNFALLLSSLFFLLRAQCQPIINHAENYHIGDTIEIEGCGYYLTGSSGPNHVWDYSALPSTDSLKGSIRVINSKNTGSANNFPSAKIAETFGYGDYVYSYYVDDKLYESGESDSLFMNIYESDIKYPHGVLQMQNKIQYGDIITENYSDKLNQKQNFVGGAGTVTLTADGYGTLILPNSTYSNVLRVKRTQRQKDSLYDSFNRNWTFIYTTSISCSWFDDKHASPLLEFDSATNSIDTNSVRTYEFGGWYLISESDNNMLQTDSKSKVNFWPNPASKIIDIEGFDGGTISINLLSGATIFSTQMPPGQQTLALPDLNTGIYLIKFQSQKDCYISKLEIIRY